MAKSNMMIEHLLQGSALWAVMTPDDEIPRNAPLHDEHFQLSHIILSGQTFFGITHDAVFTVFEKILPPASFYYTNIDEIFGTFSPESALNEPANQMRFQLMSLKRYKKHEFKISRQADLVWEYNGVQDNVALKEVIHAGGKLSIAFLDDENVWNIHPVLYCRINSNSNQFELRTHYTIYPYLFRNPDAMTHFIKNNLDPKYFEEKTRYQNQIHVVIHYPFFAFYHLFDNGTYMSYYDLSRGNTINRYRNLKIFAETL